jgi:Schlafen, AlbA_2
MALTGDYWTITLPNQLATSAARSPSRFAYQAALILLDALALYSPIKISTMLDPVIKGTKAALEQHHLFPRGFLEDTGVTDLKQINQIANFAPVEWPSNIKIGKSSPADYVPMLDAALSAAQREQLYFWHALPLLWWQLSHERFLFERRGRMAQVIHAAWKQLTGNLPEIELTAMSIGELISAGEGDAVEFKSTFRFNLHTGQPDEKIQMAALKSIAGFLNAKGGTLIIGVADNGDVLGLNADGFANKDKMALHLNNLIKDRIGDIFLPYIHADFEKYNDGDEKETPDVMAIRCEKGPKAAFVKDGAVQRFFVRGPNATAELHGTSITDYVKQRFE